VSTPANDPVVMQFRDQISDNDLKIIDAINKRIKLVAQLREYKVANGIEFVDPQREQWMLTFVSRANNGPISGEGLREIYDHIVSLTKAEVLRQQK
jgi:chorismate mutase / prephenate dehydratase